MCDYSLHAQKTRKAAVGDKLVVSKFMNTATKGIREHGGDIETATCMLPGTEVAFTELPVEHKTNGFLAAIGFRKTIESKVARFTQVNIGSHCMHHDALQFASGETVLINDLEEGTQMSVLQLGRVMEPAKPTVYEQQVEWEHGVVTNHQLRLTSGEEERTAELVKD